MASWHRVGRSVVVVVVVDYLLTYSRCVYRSELRQQYIGIGSRQATFCILFLWFTLTHL